MEYSLLVLVLVLVATMLWQTHRTLVDAQITSEAVLEHAKGTAEFLARQQAEVLALVERIVNPPHVVPGRAEVTEEEIDAALGEVGWDPTDADPFLHDDVYAGFVPKQQFNDAPPVVTHPMGIPGLEVPYGMNGHAADTRVDL